MTKNTDDQSIGKLLDLYAEQISKIDGQNSADLDSPDSTKSVEDKIEDINSNIIQREEKQKLKLRKRLSNTVTKYLWVQLVFFNVIVLIIVLSVTTDICFFKWLIMSWHHFYLIF